MVYKIVWTPKALESYVANMLYLQKRWTEKEMKGFAVLVEHKIELLPASRKLAHQEVKANQT